MCTKSKSCQLEQGPLTKCSRWETQQQQLLIAWQYDYHIMYFCLTPLISHTAASFLITYRMDLEAILFHYLDEITSCQGLIRGPPNSDTVNVWLQVEATGQNPQLLATTNV